MVISACEPRNAAPSRWERCKIAPESWVLALICLADLSTTLFWVSYRDAAEGNPLMNFYLKSFGPYAFIGAKCILFLMPLLIAEWARRHRPRFVRGALRFCVIGYLACYCLGVAQVNRTAAQAREEQAQEAYLLQPIYTPHHVRPLPRRQGRPEMTARMTAPRAAHDDFALADAAP